MSFAGWADEISGPAKAPQPIKGKTYLGRHSSIMLENVFLDSAKRRFAEYKSLGELAMAQLDAAGINWTPNASVNSIAVIVQHLHGNMLSRWTGFLTEDGEKPWRQRDAEFEPNPLSVSEVQERWNAGWAALFGALEALRPEDLERQVTIRHQPLSVVDAINRQIAHYCGHVGQIVLMAKMVRGEDWKTLSIPKGGSNAYNEQLKNGSTSAS